jgi:GTP-binding protein
MCCNEKIRNVAIIAHVDHGKTTLVDEMLKQSGVFRDNQEVVDCVMDSNDLERERGITIMAKNTAVTYGDTKINIVDTPGHADFGGEVERILKMVNGVILLVDAAEGPMPQTRFVLSRALELGHRVIVVVNKIDRPDQRIHEVMDEILELLIDLNATDEQLDSPMLFCSGRNGTASLFPGRGHRPQARCSTPSWSTSPPRTRIWTPRSRCWSPTSTTTTSWAASPSAASSAASIKQNQEIDRLQLPRPRRRVRKAKAVSLYEFDGLQRDPVTEVGAGNIIAISGIGDITIGDALRARVGAATLREDLRPHHGDDLLRQRLPLRRDARANTSRPATCATGSTARLLKDVSLRVDGDGHRRFNVAGRGEMHLSILIETMRREGYEFQVSPPRVLYQEIDGKLCEPIERVVADVPEDSVGAVIEKLPAQGRAAGDDPRGQPHQGSSSSSRPAAFSATATSS